jgi:pimeloyl-ACP methyl ester carboxylesterase
VAVPVLHHGDMVDFALPDGRRLSYLVIGEGPAVVCHPGGPGAPATSLGDLGGLSRAHTLIVVEPRGTGNSDAPADPGAYALDDYVEDLETLREQLGLERVTLLGHSHGAFVALAYAAAHPGRVERLVLVAAAARWSDDHAAATEAAMAERSGEPWFADAVGALTAEEESEPPIDGEDLGALVARTLPMYFGTYGAREAAYVEASRSARWNGRALRCFEAEEFERFDLRAGMARVTAPTLVVAGRRDFLLGPESCREVADGIRGARLEVMAGVGHFPWVEAPERFREMVTDFLAPPRPAGGSGHPPGRARARMQGSRHRRPPG